MQVKATSHVLSFTHNQAATHTEQGPSRSRHKPMLVQFLFTPQYSHFGAGCPARLQCGSRLAALLQQIHMAKLTHSGYSVHALTSKAPSLLLQGSDQRYPATHSNTNITVQHNLTLSLSLLHTDGHASKLGQGNTTTAAHRSPS